MALVLITVITALGFSFLQIVLSGAKRQVADVDRIQAFYLAEAGLAEAFQAVRMGRTGQVGSDTSPAAYGEGLLWVDAVQTEDANVRLTSTGVVGMGRVALSLVVEPVEVALGFFSQDSLTVDGVLLVDGYNSEEGTYDATLANLELHQYANWLMGEMGAAKLMSYLTGTDEIPASQVSGETSLTPEEAEAFVAQYGELRSAYEAGGVTLDEAQATVQGEPPPQPVEHTGSGGLVASNGSIALVPPEGSPVAVYGDAVPGPEGSLSRTADVTVSGTTRPRWETVELPPVEVPEVTMAPPVRHDGLLPLVVAAGETGHERIEVAAGAELVLLGPATIVIGELVLEPDALLTMDTRLGNVELYVTGGMDLQPGSTVVTSEEPSELSLRIPAIPSDLLGPPVRLEATSRFHGTIYAPETEVYVGSDFEIFGGVAAKRLEFGPGAKLHFDAADVAGAIPRIISWRIVSIPDTVRGGGSDPFRLFGIEPGDATPLAESHDLDAVVLEITFLHSSGDTRLFLGVESGFDWDEVVDILSVERSPLRDGEDTAPKEVTGRTDVFEAITTLTGSDLRTYLESVSPLMDGEVIAALDASSMSSTDTLGILTYGDPPTYDVLERLLTHGTTMTSGDLRSALEFSSPLPNRAVDLLLNTSTSLLTTTDRDAVLALQ